MSITLRCGSTSCGRTFDIDPSPNLRQCNCPHCDAALDLSALATMEPSDVGESVSFRDAQETLPTAPDAGSGWTSDRIGRFSVTARLGEGAFGVVYRAHDPQLDREVALKVAKPGSLQTSQGVERFFREARAAARLRHPNIVPLYDAGQTDNQHYIATAFIAGRTLQGRMDEKRLTHREAATVVRRLAEALGYAHAQGIVHRDVKPANVMLDEQGEPLLMDFGLASRQADAEKLTHEGTVMGTPLYMAPEQAAGQRGEAKPASDQYGLGVMLYEMLCGEPPFRGTIEMVLMRHQKEEPVSPRRRDAAVPRDLETICLKCLEKEPSRRYGSCQDLADDLRRWLDGEPIKARRLSLTERLVRWCRREPRLAASLAVTVLALVAVAVVSAVSAGIQTELREEAEKQAEIATEQQEKAEEQEGIAKQESKRAGQEADKATEESKRAEAQAKRARTVSEFMRKLFITSDPTGLSGIGLLPAGDAGRKVTAEQLLEQGAKQIQGQFEDDPLTKAALLDAIGDVMRTLGLYPQSRPLLEEALALRRKHLKEDDPETTTSIVHLGNWHAEKGSYVTAEELYKEALERLSRTASGTLEEAEAQLRLAAVLISIGKEGGEPAARAGLATRKKLLGDRHRDTAVAKFTLAAGLLDRSKNVEAGVLVVDSLPTMLESVGKESEGAVAAVGIHQQALLMSRAKLEALAEPSYRKALAQMQNAMGRDHMYNLILLYDLGECLYHQKKYKDAEEVWRECAVILRKTVGMEHPRASKLIHRLTYLFVDQKRYGEARLLLIDTLEAMERRYGRRSVLLGDPMLSLAWIEAKAGNHTQARDLALEAVALLSEQDQPPHAYLLDLLTDCLYIVRRNCELGALRIMYGRLLNWGRTREGKDAEFYVIDLAAWADILVSNRRYAEAEPLLREALPRSQTDKDRWDHRGFVLRNLAEAEWALNRPKDAATSYREAIPLLKKSEFNRDHREAHLDLCMMLIEQGMFAEALTEVEQFRRIEKLDPESTAWTHNVETLLRCLTDDRAGAEVAARRIVVPFAENKTYPIPQYRARSAAACSAELCEAELPRIEAALKADPNERSLITSKGLTLFRLGRNAELAALAAKDPEDYGFAFRLAYLLAKYRLDKTELNRKALIVVLLKGEEFIIKNRRGGKNSLNPRQCSMMLDIVWVCRQVRAELNLTRRL